MSLKERLNIKTVIDEQEQIVSLKKTLKPKNKNLDYLKEIINNDCNILIFCDIDTPTYSAVNYLCSMIENDKRLVGIGSNLLLNPDEIIKFEPETKDISKELIKTAINLNPYKIVLQDFDGVEAVDIFKLVNAGIKNIITAVNAKSPQNALMQVEMNLYINGVNIPQTLMKPLISDFIDRIIYIKNEKNTLKIENIYEFSLTEDNNYNISEIKPEKADSTKNKKNQKPQQPKTSTKKENLTLDVIKEAKKKNILAEKLKKRKLAR